MQTGKVLSYSLPLLSMGNRGVHVTDYLIGVAQEISGSLIKTIYLGEAKIEIRLGVKPRFGIMGFSISDAKLEL